MASLPSAGTTPTQPRAIETRRRVLAATFDTLVECGYAGTTTYEVCRRAKVSRGTLLYHFPTRAELLTAALQDLVEKQMTEFAEEATRLAPGKRTVSGVVELLWKQIRSPANDAWLELIVASRTDPDLLVSVQSMMARLNGLMERIFEELFPRPAGADRATASLHAFAPYFTFFLLHGLSLSQIYQPGEHVDRTLQAAAELGAFLEVPTTDDTENP